MNVQDKIAELERQVARKKALVNAKIVLPKDTPDDVKSEISVIITEALMQLAADDSVKGSSTFTEEEVNILKLLVKRAQTKTPVQPTKVTKSEEPKDEKVLGKINKTPDKQGEYQGKEAEIMSLDAVPVRQRGKVAAMEKCMVMEERPDGLLHVLTMGGVRFNISPEDLNFDIESK